MTCIVCLSFRWNERLLREVRQEEDDSQWRHRAGRLDKWKELARLAAERCRSSVELPDSIQPLEICSCFYQDGLGLLGV